MGNWLSTEPGLSSVNTVQIPSGQRDDNRRGGEETEGKGRNRTAVEGYTCTVFEILKLVAAVREDLAIQSQSAMDRKTDRVTDTHSKTDASTTAKMRETLHYCRA